MVTFSHLFTLSLMALCAQFTQVDAIPKLAVSRAEASPKSQRFSFARWVDDKFANPHTALSPKQAWKAYLDSPAAEKDNDDNDLPATGSSGPEKRGWDSQVKCNERNRAKAVDVVTCIENLHKSVNRTDPHCPTHPVTLIPKDKGESHTMQAWCHVNNLVVGPDLSEDLGQDETKLASCVSVAQTIGAIMDTCTTGSGDEKWVSGWREKDLTGLRVGINVLGAQTFTIG